MKRILAFLILLGISLHRALAVQQGSTYQSTKPTNSNLAHWTTGWNTSGVTGWDYVGTVNGVNSTASGVYLGNGWVLTAGHVGAGTFTLQGTAYAAVNGSAQGIKNADATVADITLFRIATLPTLAALTLAPALSNVTQVVMIGYGGGQGETWGTNWITGLKMVGVTGPYSTPFGPVSSFATYDYETLGVNGAKLVGGDSGGADFIYNSTASQWELAGINEAVNNSTADSYLVDLGNYASAIENITAVPEPTTWILFGVGAALLLVRRNTVRRLA